ncbi:mpv17-like protein 2 [Uloborus diversus]|uniref:mpv17-like protein 2 n=1 Tax=Uloborus diversus TaxID=327109 RepID=UPI0024096DA3|nr:mpv17-like protein 2 [Uloborus diversus]
MKYFSRFKNLVDRLFTKHLFVTNTSVGILFLGAGDVIQQMIEKHQFEGKTFETKRTRNMMISGCVFGVAGHYWYQFLEFKFPGQTVKAVSKKLLSEMVVGPPIFLGFFIAIGFLEKKPPKKSFEEFKKNFLLICVADWGVYAPLQALNFFYVPIRYRFLYVSALCLAYDVFLSYILHKEENQALTKKIE